MYKSHATLWNRILVRITIQKIMLIHNNKTLWNRILVRITIQKIMLIHNNNNIWDCMWTSHSSSHMVYPYVQPSYKSLHVSWNLWCNTGAPERYIASHQWPNRVQPQVIHTTSNAASCDCYPWMIPLVTLANGLKAS
jgi:hypothetical protein